MNVTELYKIFCHQKYQFSIDTRTLQTGDIFFALSGENFDGHEYIDQAFKKGASWVVMENEKYAGDKSILVSNVLETLQDLSHYHRKQFDIPVIGLTGSNGKTTTKELIAAVLGSQKTIIATKGNLNNHIGVPLTLLNIRPETEIAVIEMGANHVGEIKFLCEIAAPNYGMITNIGRAHIGLFGGFENIIRGKTELYRYLEHHKGMIFLHADNVLLAKKQGDNLESQTYSTVSTESYILVRPQTLSPFVSVLWQDRYIQSNLTGAYNIDNIAAAICVGEYFGIHEDLIQKAIESYLPHNERSEMITTGKGNTIIKDYYNANTSSMLLALENLKGIETNQSKIAILGDMFEMGEYSLDEHKTVLEKAQSLGISKIYTAGYDFCEISLGQQNIEAFKTTDALLTELQKTDFKDSLVLIKASQGMKFKNIFEGVNW